MTEADAKKKKCCMNVMPRCEGSGCMAWRWVTTVDGNKEHGSCGMVGNAAVFMPIDSKLKDLTEG